MTNRKQPITYDADDLREAVMTLRKGGIIIYPTDTIWGIGCDATNAEAVSRIYKIKKRAESKSMLILVDSPMRAQTYASGLTDVAYDMLDIADKPLTLILDGAKNLASNLIAEDGSIGIRITHESFSHDLCFRLARPVVSTSANISGEASPQTFDQISPEILNAVDYVVRYRQDDRQPCQPSSIVKLKQDGQVCIIRP